MPFHGSRISFRNGIIYVFGPLIFRGFIVTC